MLSEEEFIREIGQHQNIIHQVCNLYTNTKADREDLFQEIVLNAWTGVKNFQGKAKFSTWLYRVALNTAITHFKKSLKNAAIAQPGVSQCLLIDTVQTPDEQLTAMNHAINALSDIDKALVMLYLEDHSHKDIAEIMGMSVSNVAVKMNRIKSKLKISTKKYLS